MTALLCLALLGQTLEPSPELATKLEQLEARRPALDTRRSQARVLRVSAFVSYGLSLVCAGWGIVELSVEGASKNREPLTGTPYRPLVPPAVMAGSAVGLIALGAVLHIAAWMMDTETAHREADIDDEERLWRGKFAPPESPE